jgi:hypothetical protein
MEKNLDNAMEELRRRAGRSAVVDQELRQRLAQATLEYDEAAESYWNNLSKEDQLLAFYSVVKRIYKGEIEDKGSYRWVLYEVFGFGPEAYRVGMDCGYLYIHNAIVDGEAPVHTMYDPNHDGEL